MRRMREKGGLGDMCCGGGGSEKRTRELGYAEGGIGAKHTLNVRT